MCPQIRIMGLYSYENPTSIYYISFCVMIYSYIPMSPPFKEGYNWAVVRSPSPDGLDQVLKRVGKSLLKGHLLWHEMISTITLIFQ